MLLCHKCTKNPLSFWPPHYYRCGVFPQEKNTRRLHRMRTVDSVNRIMRGTNGQMRTRSEKDHWICCSSSPLVYIISQVIFVFKPVWWNLEYQRNVSNLDSFRKYLRWWIRITEPFGWRIKSLWSHVFTDSHLQAVKGQTLRRFSCKVSGTVSSDSSQNRERFGEPNGAFV